MTSEASVISISEADTRTAADESTQLLEAALFEAKRVLVGQDRMIERLFVCWLARGHCLLEGAPGLAKTLAAETVATVLGGTFARLQFTPDLVPADLVGTRIYRPSQRGVRRRARPGVRQRRARRRDQPGAGQGAVRAARGHGRAPRVDRRHHLRRARPVPRAGHPEPASRARASTRCPRPSATASS